MDKRVVHNATILETVVRPLETVAAPRRFRKPLPRIKVSRVGQQHMVRRKEEMRQQLSSADPMQATAKIVSLIDTVRYRNRPQRLVLNISALWSGACNGHVNRFHDAGHSSVPTRTS